MELKINTKGDLKTIPNIKSGKLIKLIGKNGVGKSLAAAFLEIICGKYQFENKNKFLKIKNSFSESKIIIDTNKDLFEILITPGTWKFDAKSFKIKENTIGFYKLNGKEISFKDFINHFSVKVIRGDENFETQLKLVSDMFIEYLERIISQIEYQKSEIKNYNSNFVEKIRFDLIEEYEHYQENYANIEEEKDSINEKYQKILDEIEHKESKKEIIGKVLLWRENNPTDLNVKINAKESEIEEYENDLEEITIDLNKIEKRISEIEEEKREQINKYMEGKKKNERDKNILIDKISKRFPEEVNEITNCDNLELVKKLEEKKNETLNKIKKKQEEEYSGEIKIKNSLLEKLSQVKRIFDDGLAEGLGSEIVIEGYDEQGQLIKLNMENLNELLNEKIIELKESPEHKARVKKLKSLEKEIKEKNKLLDFLNKWKKLIEKDKELEKWKKDISQDNLDQFVKPEIIKKSLDKQDRLLNEKQHIKMKISKFRNKRKRLKERLELTNGLESLKALEENLNKIYEKKLPEDLEKEKEKLKDRIENLNSKKSGLEFNLKRRIDKLKDLEAKIDKNKSQIMDKAKNFGYEKFSRWIKYCKQHYNKGKALINNILEPFLDYIEELRNLISRIRRNKRIKGATYLDLVSDVYNKFFLETYNNPSFFKYVFKGYKEIKKFDIEERDIIFIKENGAEDHRSLSEFSSGEKAYAFIRATINLFKENAKYKVLFVDEANALMDFMRSGDLLRYQGKLINNGKFDKIINILPIHEEPDESSEFYEEYEEKGYYQKIINL